MKSRPQDWTRLADAKTLAMTRRRPRAAGLIGAPSVVGRPGSNADGAGAAAAAPREVARPIAVLAALLAALTACWLLSGYLDARVTGALLGAGLVVALLLLITLDQRRYSRACAAEAAAARRQVENILGGLREGLFFMGRDLRLASVCSDSLSSLLRLPTSPGQRFEDVLRPLVNAETLATALTFLQLLWTDAADEDAIGSLNPLSQVEVSFAAHGGGERRYLSFSFRRVSGNRPVDDCILGLVADITDRVLLTGELEQAEADGDSQAELLLQLLRTDPLTLVSFLDDADDAFRKSNAMLSGSGNSQQQLQKKTQWRAARTERHPG